MIPFTALFDEALFSRGRNDAMRPYIEAGLLLENTGYNDKMNGFRKKSIAEFQKAMERRMDKSSISTAAAEFLYECYCYGYEQGVQI